MGVTLDELLDSSGIASLGNEEEEKTASAVDARSDADELVEALRKCASQDDSEQDFRIGAARELQEKTAEILVIRQTIEEIDKLASLGVREEEVAKLASFIKVALDKGHDEKEIAQFIEKNAAGSIGRAIHRQVMNLRRPAARRAGAKISDITQSDIRLLRDTARRGTPQELARHMAMLEGKTGKRNVTAMITSMGRGGDDIPDALKRFLPQGGKPTSQFTVKAPGGRGEFSISTDTAAKGGLAAAGLGTGLALSGKGSSNGKRKGGGVTVVNAGG